jgi:penicillin amidase
MEVLRPLLAGDERFAPLLAWDCSYGDDSHEAAWFEAFYTGLVLEVIGSVCGEGPIRHVLEETILPVHFFHLFDDVLLDPDGKWFDDGGRDAAFRNAAEAALPALSQPWGASNRIVMAHPLFEGTPSWLGFNHGPITLHGGRAPVHQGQLARAGGRQIAIGPSFRLVTDLGTDEAHTALPGGPSDRRFSRWYKSGIGDWHAGRLKLLSPNGSQAPPELESSVVPEP